MRHTAARLGVLGLALCLPPGSSAASLAGVPPPVQPAFTVPAPHLLSRHETRAIFSPVLRRVAARRAPSSSAPALSTLALSTPEGTTNIVLVLGEARAAARLWVHVRFPILPNNRTGWVPRSALGGFHFLHTHLVVDRERFTATLLYNGRAIFRARVGVGRPDSPTPAGQFYVRDKLTAVTDPFYGPVAFGTSARSAVLTDWPAGGFVGIHGTDRPDLIPGRISHGCIRMRNADILRLSRLMPVGTPLTIR
ncbi:MAG TPA: L,D-transpeptidase [Gaiellaceae bacterium]